MTSITKILSEQEREQLEKTLKGRSSNAKILAKIIKSKLKELDRPLTEGDLAEPNWQYIRAYRDGGRHYLTTLLTLFEEKE